MSKQKETEEQMVVSYCVCSVIQLVAPIPFNLTSLSITSHSQSPAMGKANHEKGWDDGSELLRWLGLRRRCVS